MFIKLINKVLACLESNEASNTKLPLFILEGEGREADVQLHIAP